MMKHSIISNWFRGHDGISYKDFVKRAKDNSRGYKTIIKIDDRPTNLQTVIRAYWCVPFRFKIYQL